MQETGASVMYQIEFEPIGRRGKGRENATILECARELGIGLTSICGGQGTCGGCRIQIIKGDVEPVAAKEKELFSPEQLAQGWRLACRALLKSDTRIYIPPESMNTRQRMQTESREPIAALNPAVRTYDFKLKPPFLEDSRSDVSRLLESLPRQIKSSTADISILRTLSSRIREWNWTGRVSLRANEIISIAPPGSPEIGFAVDVGTTKIAAYLVNLRNGDTLASDSMMNPQISYGEDVISRMRAAMKSPEEASRLSNLIINSLDDLAAGMCRKINARTSDILDCVIVGNTAMQHLMLELPVKQLGGAPYIPAVTDPLDIKARDIGLHLAEGAYIHILPNIAGFVGADHVSVLLAARADRISRPTICIDIGTNTEVSLIYSGHIFSTSCASGPAFEGGHISYGMRAAGGAIERLKIIDGNLVFQTVDGLPPSGLCGSGALDALAEFYLDGAIDESGRIVGDHHRVKKSGNQLVCIVTSNPDGNPDILLTQQDVRELQLAKGAMRTGIAILLERAGLKEDDIEQFLVAGAFGSYINISSAITCGMLPSLPVERFRQIGNAAGGGARRALISKTERLKAGKLARKAEYVNLAFHPSFKRTFAQAMYLGKYRLLSGKREKIN